MQWVLACNSLILCMSIATNATLFITHFSHRDIDDKFDRSEMSGNIQNTAARDKLTREVQGYFKDTLWTLADGDDPAKLENLIKAFVVSLFNAMPIVRLLISNVFTLYCPNTQVMYEESTKKIAEVVDRFTVEFQKERDVTDALSCIAQLEPQANKVMLAGAIVHQM